MWIQSRAIGDDFTQGVLFMSTLNVVPATEVAVEVMQDTPAVPPTSKIPFEVETAPQAEVTVLINFAKGFRSFNKSLTTEVKAAAIALKKAFAVKKGSRGKTLLVNGDEMYWSEFVKKHFDITPTRFNQIMDIEDAVPISVNGGRSGSGSSKPDLKELKQKIADLEESLQNFEEENDKLKADPIAAIVADWSTLPIDEVRDRYETARKNLTNAWYRAKREHKAASTSAVVEDDEIEPLLESL
jgi:hypothetical protein